MTRRRTSRTRLALSMVALAVSTGIATCVGLKAVNAERRFTHVVETRFEHVDARSEEPPSPATIDLP